MVLAYLWYKYQVSNLFLKFCRKMYIGITTTKLNCYKENTNLIAILTMTISEFVICKDSPDYLIMIIIIVAICFTFQMQQTMLKYMAY